LRDPFTSHVTLSSRSRSRRRLTSCAVLAASLLVAVSASHARADQSSLPPLLKRVKHAFMSGDADALRQCFPRREPVLVAFAPTDPPALLGPGPLDARLQRLMREQDTVDFDLPDPLPSAGASTSAYVKVRWTHQPASSDTLLVDYLYLTLRYAGGEAAWQITEIKALRR